MNLYFWLFVLYALLILPLSAQISIRIENGVHYRVRLQAAGLPVIRKRAEPSEQEQHLRSAAVMNGMKQGDPALLLSLVRGGHMQRALKALDWQKIEVNACIAFPDAAQTALVCAALRTFLESLSRCYPTRLSSRLTADFRGQGSKIDVHCIVSARLGSLSAAAIRLYLTVSGIQAKRLMAEEERYAAASH